MTTIYQSSSGPKLIADMNPHNVRAALAKLQREGAEDRQPEIEALSARAAELDAEAPAPPAPAPSEGRLGIGGNNPPEATPFEAIRVHIDDLYIEAKNWADGAEVTTDAQAVEVDRLIDDFKAAIRLATETQDAELAPLATQEKAIRERYYPLIGKTKAITGTAIRARDALLAVKTKWGAKQQAIRDAEAERLRAEAFAKAREAVAATKAAPDDLEAAESAEDLIRAAQSNLRQAKAVENTKALGYRTVWNVTVEDETLALRTMWSHHRPELVAYALDLARRDVREGKRQIAGFVIEPQKVAA